MKRAIGFVVFFALLGGAITLGVLSDPVHNSTTDVHCSLTVCSYEAVINAEMLIQRCPVRGSCVTEPLKRYVYLELIEVGVTEGQGCGPGDCGAVPEALQGGWAPGTWQIVAPALSGLQRPEPIYVELEAGKTVEVTLTYRSAPDTRLVETLDTLPPFGGNNEGSGDPSLLNSVRRYRHIHPEVSAGEFVAQGFLYVGFTESPRRHLMALRKSSPAPELLRAFKADYSYDELRALQDEITSDFATLEEQGFFVSGVGVDVYANRVGVTLQEITQEALSLMRDRYGGDSLIFDEGTSDLLG